MKPRGVNVRKVINKLFDHEADGVSVRATVQAVVAANVNEKGTTTTARAQQPDNGPSPGDEGGTNVRKD